jgi:hypothetical protein
MSEQRANALAAEDESRVWIDANLDLVIGALNDRRVRQELRMFERRM